MFMENEKHDEKCEHSDICKDERICLNCGKDMSEELACEAENIIDTYEDR